MSSVAVDPVRQAVVAAAPTAWGRANSASNSCVSNPIRRRKGKRETHRLQSDARRRLQQAGCRGAPFDAVQTGGAPGWDAEEGYGGDRDHLLTATADNCN